MERQIYPYARKVLFKFYPETAHTISMHSLETLASTPLAGRMLQSHLRVDDSRLSQNLFSTHLRFSNPVGLSAGVDKNAQFLRMANMIGAGFHEVGAVTPKPQGGNPKPRIFRYPQYNVMINGLGFNNQGLDAVQQRLMHKHPAAIPVGVNVGKNKWTVNAIDDYIAVVRGLQGHCDYLTINVSSPNTKGLRDLQTVDFLREVVSKTKSLTHNPVLVKLAPDLKVDFAVELAKEAVSAGAAGMVLTNTTLDHRGVDEKHPVAGGLSGRLLESQSEKMLHEVAKELFGKIILIGVGGISEGTGALSRLENGASLIQLYTALVYKGPSVIHEINSWLLHALEVCKFDNVREFIGSNLRK